MLELLRSLVSDPWVSFLGSYVSLSSRQSGLFSSTFLAKPRWRPHFPGQGPRADSASQSRCLRAQPSTGCTACLSPSWLSSHQPGAASAATGDRPGQRLVQTASLIMNHRMPPEPLTGHLIDLVGVPTALCVQPQELDAKIPLRGSGKPGEAAAPRTPRRPPQESSAPRPLPAAPQRGPPYPSPVRGHNVAHWSGVTGSPALLDTAGGRAARARPG